MQIRFTKGNDREGEGVFDISSGRGSSAACSTPLDESQNAAQEITGRARMHPSKRWTGIVRTTNVIIAPTAYEAERKMAVWPTLSFPKKQSHNMNMEASATPMNRIMGRARLLFPRTKRIDATTLETSVAPRRIRSSRAGEILRAIKMIIRMKTSRAINSAVSSGRPRTY